jgi:hypothetical protein
MGDRFWSKVDKTDTCWLWTGGCDGNGYGQFKIATGQSGGRKVLAHRLAYELTKGPIVNVINHLCETKACVNPDHLEDVTQAENLAYSRPDTCLRGHSLLEVTPNKWGRRACKPCQAITQRDRRIRLGDIGKIKRVIEFEPLPETAPVQEPAVEPEREPVPA